MHWRPHPCLLPVAIVALLAGGCMSSGGDQTVSRAPPTRAGDSDVGSETRAAGEDAESGEERETEEDMRLRERAKAALATYRAPSCAAAIAKIEGFLRQGKGRWQERRPGAPMADDLVKALSEAELWAAQSRALCQADPLAARFQDLQLLMEAIWRYPVSVSQAEFERRLRVLGE